MSSLVPFIEHGGDAAFPIFTPGTMMPPTMSHAAEEEHLHGAKEQEEEQEGEADRAEGIEEVRMPKSIRLRVAISIHHR